MVTIPTQVFENENPAHLDTWTRASKFMEDFQSQVWLEICTRWFGLANYTELYFEVIDFFNTVCNAQNGLMDKDRNGLIIPMIPYHPENLIEAMEFDDNRRQVDPSIYFEPNWKEWEDYRYAAAKYPNQQF